MAYAVTKDSVSNHEAKFALQEITSQKIVVSAEINKHIFMFTDNYFLFT